MLQNGKNCCNKGIDGFGIYLGVVQLSQTVAQLPAVLKTSTMISLVLTEM